MMYREQAHISQESLEIFHLQTKEWISEVEFYKYELHFLMNIVLKRIGSNTLEGQDHKDIYRHADQMLATLSDEIATGLADHEKYLDGLIGSKYNEQEREYIAAHKAIAQKMAVLKLGIQDLKQSVFNYVKHSPFGKVTQISDEV